MFPYNFCHCLDGMCDVQLGDPFFRFRIDHVDESCTASHVVPVFLNTERRDQQFGVLDRFIVREIEFYEQYRVIFEWFL